MSVPNNHWYHIEPVIHCWQRSKSSCDNQTYHRAQHWRQLDLPEVTGGIEPLTYKSYKKRDFVGDRIYVNKIYKQLLESKEKVPEWFVDSDDLKPEDHFEMQSVVQKYVDGSVSKTINMPKGSNKKDLNKLLLEYIHDLKGCTVYVDGSKGEQPYQRLTEEQTIEFILEEKTKDIIDEELTQCATGNCGI